MVMDETKTALAHQSVGDCLVVLVMELAALAHQSMTHQSIDGPIDHITNEKKKRTQETSQVAVRHAALRLPHPLCQRETPPQQGAQHGQEQDATTTTTTTTTKEGVGLEDIGPVGKQTRHLSSFNELR
jgi:hypothetical protein